MLPYDSRRNYFGAENTRLAEVLGEILSYMPALRDGWNYTAYLHDVAYHGTKKNGWFARMINFYRRRKADNKFRDGLEDAVIFAEEEGSITAKQADRAMVLAAFSHNAVRYLGWKFYKTGGQNA